MGDLWVRTPNVGTVTRDTWQKKNRPHTFWRKVKAWCGCCVSRSDSSKRQTQKHRDPDETRKSKTQGRVCQIMSLSQRSLFCLSGRLCLFVVCALLQQLFACFCSVQGLFLLKPELAFVISHTCSYQQREIPLSTDNSRKQITISRSFCKPWSQKEMRAQWGVCLRAFFSCLLCAAIETWLNRNRYLIVAAFQGISAKKEVNKKDQKQKTKIAKEQRPKAILSSLRLHFYTTHDHQFSNGEDREHANGAITVLFLLCPLFSHHNWDLVDSASSHMLVSRTKPCMPQNHCIAGICAWLITSDVICRKNLRSPHIGYLGETPS